MPAHKLRILETDREGPLLAATVIGRRRSLTGAALLQAFLALPLVTFKIVAPIRWEALRLWRANGATPKCRNREYHLGGWQGQ